MAFVSVYDPDVKRLLDALGIDTKNTTRVVLDINCDSAVTLHVQSFATKEKIAALADAFEGLKVVPVESVVVDERGNVIAQE